MFKKSRKGGYEDFGRAETWYIQASATGSKKFQIALLTNDKTVSAGDVFALIMQEIP